MLSFILESPTYGTISVGEQQEYGHKIYTLNYPCLSSVTCTPYIATLPIGKYKFEVIGAGGGYADSTNKHPGGDGGLSVGYYELKAPTTAFFYIGGKGPNGNEYNGLQNTPGGYNGGGNGGYYPSSTSDRGGGGGGSSDIRISSNSIYNRIIVAGGGGGGCIDVDSAGNGGGSSGTPGKSYVNSIQGGAGTQLNGGSAYSSRGASEGYLSHGGQGSTNVRAHGSGGGGGGFYGGGGGSSTKDDFNGNENFCASGGGGSGYIGGVQNSSKYRIIASTSEFRNKGNGQIKITILDDKFFDCICSKGSISLICRFTNIHALTLFFDTF